MQQLLLHPRLTLHVAAAFRPLLLRVVAQLVQDVCAASAGGGEAGSAEAAVALVALLELAPQCEG